MSARPLHEDCMADDRLASITILAYLTCLLLLVLACAYWLGKGTTYAQPLALSVIEMSE